MKQPYGVITLAAYKPDEELFLVQLKSLQNQTHKNFTCLIGADSGYADIVSFIEKHFGDDSRFQVVGFDDNVGFYRNFERILQAVPETAQWVALCDQDDYWYPNKLEILLPYLKNYSLVSGQARVMSYPEKQVLAESTGRKNVPFPYLVLQNQFTGAICVLRPELLQKAFPFPNFYSSRNCHDHWLALCANFMQGNLVVNVVVQDYMQHAVNVIGEASKEINFKGAKKRIQNRAQKLEGNNSYKAILAMCQQENWGHSTQVTQFLLEKFKKDINQKQFFELYKFHKSRYPLVIWKTLFISLFNKKCDFTTVLAFILGIPGGFFVKTKNKNLDR